MKIKHISIKNYRSLKNVELDVDNYTVFVGQNGSGKSCVLYALKWFFEGNSLKELDIYGCEKEGEANSLNVVDKIISVEVSFSDLSDRDKERLQKYGRGDIATFKRLWTFGDGKDKIIGHSLQGPGFSTVRTPTSIAEKRNAYAALRGRFADLPELNSRASKEDIETALQTWESNPIHKAQLEEIDSDDAANLFGFNGKNVIADCVQFILIPAACNITSEIGVQSKETALGRLISIFVDNASKTAKQQWINKHQVAINELKMLLESSVVNSTKVQQDRVNAMLETFIPNSRIIFTPSTQDWEPKINTNVRTAVNINGGAFDVINQGHGVQRAVLMSLLYSLAPDQTLIRQTCTKREEESESDYNARVEAEINNLPALFICIEEPEIYQHPVRARAFAKVLEKISMNGNSQVMVATHSPYFILPAQFEKVRRFSLFEGETKIYSTTLSEISTTINDLTADDINKFIHKQLQTNFSEGFFCDKVVLVEGDTDKIVLEAIAEKVGQPFDEKGILVICMAGKGALKIPYFLLDKLNIAIYVIFDADALGAARKHPTDIGKQRDAHNSHMAATDNILSWLPMASSATAGILPARFGNDTVVTAKYCMFKDDIENELKQWPSFMSAIPDGALRSKYVLTYKEAIEKADINDMPDIFNKIIKAVIE